MGHILISALLIPLNYKSKLSLLISCLCPLILNYSYNLETVLLTSVSVDEDLVISIGFHLAFGYYELSVCSTVVFGH